jgi:hypothetical protein
LEAIQSASTSPPGPTTSSVRSLSPNGRTGFAARHRTVVLRRYSHTSRQPAAAVSATTVAATSPTRLVPPGERTAGVGLRLIRRIFEKLAFGQRVPG